MIGFTPTSYARGKLAISAGMDSIAILISAPSHIFDLTSSNLSLRYTMESLVNNADRKLEIDSCKVIR